MDSLYQEIILDHYRNPVGRGLREPYEAEVHHVNTSCGDEITLRVHLSGSGEQATVEDISYDNQGCSISQASASVMYELLLHRTLAEAMATREQFSALMNSATSQGATVVLDDELLGDAMAFSGVARFPGRIKCALLAWEAWMDAAVRAAAEGGGR